MIQYEGPGWRLAKDTSRDFYTVMMGGEGWAIELTYEEWTSLRSLIEDLLNQHKKLENQLMPEESICIELEKSPWWGCLDGDRNSWSLQLVFENNNSYDRGFEAYWPIPAAQSMAVAMRKMWESCQ